MGFERRYEDSVYVVEAWGGGRGFFFFGNLSEMVTLGFLKKLSLRF